MSIIYCDYCNHSAPKQEWKGFCARNGEVICDQCEDERIANVELEFDAADRIPFIEWSN